jgi:hypothetical protein
MVKSKQPKIKARKVNDGISRSERKRRSKLLPENPNVLLPDNPLYLATKRKQMKRYGSELPREYRYYDVGEKDWIDWNPTVHKTQERVEECALFRFIRKNKDQPDLNVEEGYNTGSSMNHTLHLTVNHPGSTGSAGTSNNSEWVKFCNFTEAAFPNTKEARLIKSWREQSLISEAPFNGLLFPFEWNKAITCMYLKCIVTPSPSNSRAGFDGDMESEYNSYKPMTKVMTFKRTQTMELNPASALGNHISFRGY